MNDHLLQRSLGNRRWKHLSHKRFAMRVAEVRVVRAGFADVLGAMREWLDRNDRPLAHFETEADDSGSIITIKVRFERDDLAELFRGAFNASYGVDRRAGASQQQPRRRRFATDKVKGAGGQERGRVNPSGSA
jgi:hypothetical protein